MNNLISYEERWARVIFLRDHLLGLQMERRQKGLDERAIVILEIELNRVKEALRKLDPYGILPP